MNTSSFSIRRRCFRSWWLSAWMVGQATMLIAFADIPVVPREQAIATLLETKTICRQPGRFAGPGSEFGVTENGHPKVIKEVIEPDRYLGWATMVKTREGELIVGFSGDRDSHVCPWGKTQLIRSSDQGKTWSEAQTITNTPLDDRDTGLIQTKEGTLLVSWFTSIAFTESRFKGAVARYGRYAEKVTPEVRKQWLGHWTKRSEDGGKTWDEPVKTVASAPHGPIQLRDGRLLYMGHARIDGKLIMVIEESRDDGRSWQQIATIEDSKRLWPGWSEPHILELASGKILGMIRNQAKDGLSFLLQTESTDGGKTWTTPAPTEIWGFPPHLLQLKNGWILVTYGYRRAPFGERACISRDEGKTWDISNEVVLDGAEGPDLGYPSSVQLDDGSILTVYYQPEKKGGPTMLMSTHWRLK